MTQEGRSYEDPNVRARDPLDAIRDWYHLTGEELRRTEYDYYRYFRRKKLVHRYQNKNKVEHGKFFVMPEYTKEQEE